MLTVAKPPARHEEPSLLLNVSAVARLLSISPRTVWGLIYSGRLEHCRINRRVLVPRAALERIAASGSSAPDS